MSLTNRDVESAYLHAKEEVEKWQQDFLAGWYRNEINLLLVMLYDRMDPLMKRYFKLTNPAAYEAMEQRVKMTQAAPAEGGNNGE